MKVKNLIAVAVATVFIAGMAIEAIGAPRKDEKKKLTEENIRLQSKIDSLCKELDLFKIRLHQADSINQALVEPVKCAQGSEVSELEIMEYTQEVSDSLLHAWYTQQNNEEYVEGVDLGSERLTSNIPDSVYIRRLKEMNSFITLPYNEIVRDYLILYSEKMKSGMKKIIGLSGYYMPIFQETFNRHGLPEELKAMAIIESSLNPTAVSRAGAKGMWQFMYNTAKIYNLHIDSFVDERLDPVKSAEAAAQYLKDAYAIFGDWNLAIASYNCGAGNVNKAIRRSGGKRAFWDIYPYLPRETRGYVPAFVGALYALTYYKEHGIKPEAIEMPAHVDTFKINKMLHLRQVSDLTGAPLDELKDLNPQYSHEIIPGNSREYILRIPYNYTNAFIDQEDSLYRHKADEYFNPVTLKKIVDGADGERIVYKVKSGDALGKIASRYRCTVAQIKRWNNLSSNNIRIGQNLVIYRGGSAPSSTSSSSSSSSKATAPANATTYVVKSGDVLGKIAERHGCTVAQLKAWNGLTSNNIQVGQKLIVSAAASSSQTSSSASSQSGEYTTYTVKSGDSLYSISKNYPGVSANDIMNFNGLTNSNIKPGMTIKIPKK